MFVPYFSVDNELNIFKKLKVMFFVIRLRKFDFLFLLLFIIPAVLNLIYGVLIKGGNSFLVVFNSIYSLYSGKDKFTASDWLHVMSVGQLTIYVIIFVMRSYFGFSLYRAMKKYETSNPPFKWSRRSMFWLTIFIPMVSFVVYSSVTGLSNYKKLHKYNL